LGLLIYGVAWALLPEATDGRIHLQEAIRGRFDAALAGAILFALIGGSRIGFWWGGWANLPITFGLLALSGLIIVIVLAVRASSKHNGTPPGSAGAPSAGPASPPPPGSSGPTPPAGGGPTPPAGGGPTPPAGGGPTPPAGGGTPPQEPGPPSGPGATSTAADQPPEEPQSAGAVPAPYEPQAPGTTYLPPAGEPPTDDTTEALPAQEPHVPPSEQDDAMTDAYGAAWTGDRTATTGHGAPAGTGGPWAATHETAAGTTTYHPGTPVPPTPPPRPPRPRRRGPGHGLVRATWGFALVAVAAMVLGGEYYDWQVSRWRMGLGCALSIFGLGVCVAGFLGRRSGSLSFMGVAVVVVRLPWALVARTVNGNGALWNSVDYGEMRGGPD